MTASRSRSCRTSRRSRPSANVRAHVVAASNNRQTQVSAIAPSSYIRMWQNASGRFLTQSDTRVAVGARRKAILWQFLVEAVVLATAGDALGVPFGIGGSSLVAVLAGWPEAVSLTSVALAAAFSAPVGIFYGYYPASKASRLNPIVALHFE